MKNIISTKAMTLAHQIHKQKPDLPFSICLCQAWAWAIVKGYETKLIHFTKKDGTVAKRVVSANYQQFYSSKGTGRKRPEGLKLFADLGKVLTGQKTVIISTYENNILLNV